MMNPRTVTGPDEDAATGQPSNIVRMSGDPGLMRLSGRDQTTVTGGNAESSQRFTGEVKYVSFFGERLASVIGMQRLEMGVAEDREGQTAFARGAGGEWEGMVSGTRRAIREVREALNR